MTTSTRKPSEEERRAKNRERQRRYRTKNRDAVNAKQRAAYAKAPKRHRNMYQRDYRSDRRKQLKSAQLFRTYGISLEQRDQMLADQGCVCAICKSPTPNSKLDWAVDHCHSTGRVRGILCHPCNKLLGYARDSQLILSNAIQYLN